MSDETNKELSFKKRYKDSIKTFEEWTKIIVEEITGIKIITSSKVKKDYTLK